MSGLVDEEPLSSLPACQEKTTEAEEPLNTPNIEFEDVQRELAAAREEIERFQDLTCTLQDTYQTRIAELNIANDELSTKLKILLEEKDSLETALQSLKTVARPPTITELKNREQCNPLAVIVHDHAPFVVVERENLNKGVCRRIWSISDDIPGGRIGNKLCDGDEWGSFRAEEDISVLDVPIYITMLKESVVKLEEEMMELNRQKVLLAQNQPDNESQANRVTLLIKDDNDEEVTAQIQTLQEEVIRLKAELQRRCDSQLTTDPSIDVPPHSVDAAEDQRVNELTRKLQIVEDQLRKVEARNKSLEQEVAELIAQQRNKMFSEQQPIPSNNAVLKTPVSEPPSSAELMSTRYKLCLRNEELEQQVKKLSEELASDTDRYRILQLKQSVTYLLSQIPENPNKEIELTIQTVIGLLGLDKEAKDRLGIKRTALKRGWR